MVMIFTFRIYLISIDDDGGGGGGCSGDGVGLICVAGKLDVTFHVQCQMIGTRKATITMTTFEWLGTGVLSIVARQFIAACKSPFATFPRALVWLFTCKMDGENEQISFWEFAVKLDITISTEPMKMKRLNDCVTHDLSAR